MDYDETLQFLFDALPMYQRVGEKAFKKDLTNTLALCEALDNPHEKFKSVHIGGTNGKGSSAHMLAAIMQTAGYKTGLYTSPHLKSFTERIKVNGNEITEAEVVNFVAENKTIISELKPSFFEMTVVMAFQYFAEQHVDIAVVEVGLGGRLDSTNVLNPELSLITNISLDHTDMLGETITEIAIEKAGIIKPDTPVVIGEYDSESAEVFKKIAEERKARPFFSYDLYELNLDTRYLRHTQKERDVEVEDIVKVWPAFQLKNLPGVLTSVDVLREGGWEIPDHTVVSGLSGYKEITGFKGRWQILNKFPLTICDTAHNIAGIELMIEEIVKLDYEDLYIVWGMVSDKDVDSILSLLPARAIYYFCQPRIPRAMEVETLLMHAKRYGLKGKSIEGVKEAIEAAKIQAKDSDMIFIGGSTFVVAEVEEVFT